MNSYTTTLAQKRRSSTSGIVPPKACHNSGTQTVTGSHSGYQLAGPQGFHYKLWQRSRSVQYNTALDNGECSLTQLLCLLH